MIDSSRSRMGLKLATVLPEGRWRGGRPVAVSSICSVAEHCQPGDLLVLRDEILWETSAEIDRAIAQGASAILCERPLPQQVSQFVVPDIRIAYGRLCHALTGNPSRRLRTIGITGSYGKTVTEHLLSRVFTTAGCPVACLPTGNVPDGGHFARQGERTGMDAADLATWLAREHHRGSGYAIVEAPSQSLAQHQLAGIELDAAIITNIRREHIRWHGNLKNYQTAKSRLLQYVKPDGFAVMNADDPASCQVLSEAPCPVITIGLEKPAEVSAQLIDRQASEQTFLLQAGSESFVVRTRIVGDNHIYNCLTATAVGLVMGLDPTAIVRGIEQIESVPGRMQRLECGQPFGLFIDRCHTPDSVANALTTLRELTGRRLLCVLGVDHPMPAADRAKMGRMLERVADQTVLTASHPDLSMRLHTAHEVLDGFDRPAQAHLMPDRTRAVGWTLANAQTGDIVLMAGGRPSVSHDEVTLDDEDLSRYWLEHADCQTARGWLPA